MAMTIEQLEDLFRRADFTEGTNVQEDLRKRLFARKTRAKVLPMYGALSDDALGFVNAAGDPNQIRSTPPGQPMTGIGRPQGE